MELGNHQAWNVSVKKPHQADSLGVWVPMEFICSKALPSAITKLLFIYLRHRQGINDDSWPTFKRIQDDLGLAPATLAAHSRKLEEVGLIEVVRSQAGNLRQTCSGPGI